MRMYSKEPILTLVFWIILSLPMLLISSCDNYKPTPSMVSFHTDGEIFLYTIQDEELHPHMYTSGADGQLREIFKNDQHTPLHGFVGQDRIYYISYDREAKHS